MNEISRLPTAAEIDEEAAVWVWRMDGGGASAEQRREFEAWLRRDARHQKAFNELGGVWTALDALAEAKREEKIALFAQTLPPVTEVHGLPSVRRYKVAAWTVAATLLLSIAVVAWVYRGNEAQTLATAVGQQRTVILADGSTVYLNTNTILETRLTSTQRGIHLVKGEALFKVAHDRERPFLVQAGDTRVRAVGTEFNVRMREAAVEVVVAEGRVEVESSAAPSGEAPVTRVAAATAMPIKYALNAGQRWETAEAVPAGVVDVGVDDVERTLAWRDGALIFDGEPLSEAISELNRYTDTRLIVTDSRVRDLKIGGRFRAGDVDEFLDALRKALPVSIRRASDDVVYIELRQ